MLELLVQFAKLLGQFQKQLLPLKVGYLGCSHQVTCNHNLLHLRLGALLKLDSHPL